jgi:radical SAM superfamily enzyme YgiQ (UPF0313 family)
MTLPGFVERGRVIASLPSLGLLSLAACTPPGVEVVYAELDDLQGGALEALAPESFDLVAISALTARILEAYQVADGLRAQGIAVVLGGLHVTALPEEAATHADAIVVGEGERVWPTLVTDFQGGRLKPRYEAQAFGAVNLGEVPIPRFDLLRGRNYNRITLQASRGCPMDCSFCGASRLLGGYRTKPIHRVEAELNAILDIWPRPFLELADDNTFAAKAWGRDLMKLFARHPLRWFTETDISIAGDPGLLEDMAAAGCAQVLIGLESTSARALQGLDGRNWKAAQVDQQISAIQSIQARGIPVNGCFVLGFDDDEGSFDAIRAFVEESGLCDVQITLLTPFPGTALHAKLKREGRLFREVYWEDCTLFDLTYHPVRMSAEALKQGFMDLMVDLYGDAAKARRKRAFQACLKGRSAASPMAN